MQDRWRDLDATDQSLGERTKRFVDAEVVPYLAAHRDSEFAADPADRVPWPLLDGADEAGLRLLPLPETLGGSGTTSVLSFTVVTEELARGESALVDILLQGWKIGTMIHKAAVPDVANDALRRFAADPRFLFSHCSTEPQGSSDRWLGYDAVESAMTTRAVPTDDGWRIDGRKQYITNGPDSSMYVVYATTTPGLQPSQGTSSFLVPRGTPGLEIGEVFEKIGGRHFNNAELILDNCRVPKDHLLIADTAMGTSSRLFPGAKVMIAAQAVGIAQAAYERSVEFARTRVQGGKPIMRHQAIAIRLADMAMKIEAARALVRHAARAIDRGDPNRRALMFMAKVLAGETAFEVATKAVEIHGGLGAMREGGVEKLLRDAVLFFHLDGTNDIHRFRAMKELFPGETGDYAG